MGSLAVVGDGILHTPRSPRRTSSSPLFPFGCSDSPPFIMPGRFDDGILLSPHFSSCLSSPSSLRHSGSSPRRSSPLQKASFIVTLVSCSTHSTSGAYSLSFSPLLSPQLHPSAPHQPPVLASPPLPSALLPSLPALLVSLHSLLLHLRSRTLCCILSFPS